MNRELNMIYPNVTYDDAIDLMAEALYCSKQVAEYYIKIYAFTATDTKLYNIKDLLYAAKHYGVDSCEHV